MLKSHNISKFGYIFETEIGIGKNTEVTEETIYQQLMIEHKK